MSASAVVAPDGYERFTLGETIVVARTAALSGVMRALREVPTLHGWAAGADGATPFEGRGRVWGVRLPGTAIDVVVRHARHGGVFGTVRGDRFVWPGRAPWELAAALRLQEAGVRTPDVVSYVLYPAGPGFCRCDVATRRLPLGADFPLVWQAQDRSGRDALLVAVASLLRDLRSAGAFHADLNAKNLYVAQEGDRWHAWVLDVDRVRFLGADDREVGTQNVARLVRSLRKWRSRGALTLDDDELARLASFAEARA